MLIALGIVAGVAIINATLSFYINLRILRHNNRLIKAIIANNVAEYASAEASPKDHIKQIKEENKLATVAQELADKQEVVIPLR
jgi:hypothetical protein